MSTTFETDSAHASASGRREPAEAQGSRAHRLPSNGTAIVLAFAVTIFTSAFLLFLVQPIIAKEILPVLR